MAKLVRSRFVCDSTKYVFASRAITGATLVLAVLMHDSLCSPRRNFTLPFVTMVGFTFQTTPNLPTVS
jgi:hypothetical protein